MRDVARKRVKTKRDFWQMLTVFVVVSIGLNVVWFVSGYHQYYWPVWPMLGFVIATILSAFNAFGPGNRPITDEDIDREVRKMGGETPPENPR